MLTPQHAPIAHVTPTVRRASTARRHRWLRLTKCLLLAQENVVLGGQAVLEGVMMRSPSAFAVAVRKPDGELALLSEKIPSWTLSFPVLKLPILRGAATLIQSLALGMRALNFSAEQAFPEEGDKSGAATAAVAESAAKKGIDWGIWLSLAFALVMGVTLFFLVPLGATEIIRRYWPQLGQGVAFNLVEGLIRLVIFLGYMLGISFFPDIRRLFRYHGAEHKVVHAFEGRRGMDVATVQTYTTLHPRCGTSFLLIVMMVAIVLFSFLPPQWTLGAKVVARLALVPIIAGLSYELIRLSARYQRLAVARWLTAPGLWLQRITTGPPDDRMVEVALAAFDCAADLEGDRAALVL